MVSPPSPHDGLDVTLEGGQIVVAMTGEIEVTESDEIAGALDSLSVDHDAPVVIDIADITFVDSGILRTIVVLQQHLAEHDRRVVIRNASPEARNVFKMTHLAGLLETTPV